ncbi:3'-5' exonuclease [Vibrio sp. 99-70-13A1]|uniref:3'-5' exonuclease n=1 Tax=Vibrio sp. 99-70-13A1 TaxID=2607601 RepID=UPI001493CF17|nr:3'-5' exonuclease [Vibrio sp. 99-70-13A1]NOH96297.1 3'-5' exonuclease [Vibrio sp. 99-70-13A1]
MKKLNTQNVIILDTETTGLDRFSEVVEISLICASSGKVLFNSLIDPEKPIPSDASAIHGITYQDVIGKPTFPEVKSTIESLLSSCNSLLIYNESFDIRVLFQSFKYSGASSDAVESFRLFLQSIGSKTHCVMHWYAEFYGERNDDDSFKWQSLSNACSQQSVEVSDLAAHRATADCEMTRRLIEVVNTKIKVSEA